MGRGGCQTGRVFRLLLALAWLLPATALADFNFVQVQAARPRCTDPANRTATCSERGFALQRMTAGQTDVQLFVLLAYREIDATALGARRFSFVDFGFGARWFPRSPTFWLGSRLPVRATISGSAAMGFGSDDFDYPVEISGGLAVSGLTPRGALVEGFYRATRNIAMKLPKRDVLDVDERHITAEPHAGARLSVFF